MNTFGRFFRCTTFGESHGKALGVVVDGCPAGVEFTEDDVQPLMDRRRPGNNELSSPRIESDIVEILSGTFEGLTTGMPVGMMIRNKDARSGDYDELREIFRPGHADYTFLKKYGIRDHRGGGRSSGRETASRVMAGALALKLLAQSGISVNSTIIEIHGEEDEENFGDEILAAKNAGDSIGGIIGLRILGCPPGLGDPVFSKLDASLAGALFSIGAVKGLEIGDGFESARSLGSDNNDQMDEKGFMTNHAGGILGGISNGEDIIVRIAVKPTPSIAKEQQTIDIHGKKRNISISGRHDPCIVPRVLVVTECMAALVIADALLVSERR